MIDQNDQVIINQGIAIIESLYKREDLLATNPSHVKDFCKLHLAALEHEVFGVLMLDNQHRLIKFIKLFRGTIDGASVYPREVAKEALLNNAAAIIITHNHPSGLSTPSLADKQITSRLIEALRLFDIRVLDHIIVSQLDMVSFAETGLL